MGSGGTSGRKHRGKDRELASVTPIRPDVGPSDSRSTRADLPPNAGPPTQHSTWDPTPRRRMAEPEQPTGFSAQDTTPFGHHNAHQPPDLTHTATDTPTTPADHTPPQNDPDKHTKPAARSARQPLVGHWRLVAAITALGLVGGLAALSTAPDNTRKPPSPVARITPPASNRERASAAIEPAIPSHKLHRTTPTKHHHAMPSRRSLHQSASRDRKHSLQSSPTPTATTVSDVSATQVTSEAAVTTTPAAPVTSQASEDTSSPAAPVSNQAPTSTPTSDTNSTASHDETPAHQPAFGANGSLGPGHGVGTS